MTPSGVGDLDLLEHLARALRPPRSSRDALEREHLGDLVADPERRVQRARRVLVDHRHLRGAQPAHVGVAHGEQVLARDRDPAAAHAAVARQVAQRRERGRRLAAARLADEPVGLALGDLQRDAAQHAAPLAADAVGDLEVGELERVGGGGRCGGHRSKAFAMPSAIMLTADDEDGDGEGREQHRPPVAAADQPVVLEDLQAPVGRRRLDAEAEEAERRDREDGVAQAHGELDEDRPHDVREDLGEQDVGRAARCAAARPPRTPSRPPAAPRRGPCGR